MYVLVPPVGWPLIPKSWFLPLKGCVENAGQKDAESCQNVGPNVAASYGACWWSVHMLGYKCSGRWAVLYAVQMSVNQSTKRKGPATLPDVPEGAKRAKKALGRKSGMCRWSPMS